MQKTLQFVAIQVHLNIINGKQKRARITCLKPRARGSGCRLCGVFGFSHQQSFRLLTYPTAYLQPLPSGDHHLWWYMSPLTHAVEQWDQITERQNMRRKRCPERKKKHKRTNTKNKLLLLSNPTPKLKQKEISPARNKSTQRHMPLQYSMWGLLYHKFCIFWATNQGSDF